MWKLTKSLSFILSSLLISACAPNKAEPQPFFTINPDYISNFKFGMVCPDPMGKQYGEETKGIGTGEICENLDKIVITGEQRCIFDRRAIPCTWYGYSFDYVGIESQEIICSFKDSEPGTEGNPNGIRSENTDSGEIPLKLESSSCLLYTSDAADD